MNAEEMMNTKCPVCGKDMELYDTPIMSREQKKVWGCESCRLRIPEESAEAAIKALTEKKIGLIDPPKTDRFRCKGCGSTFLIDYSVERIGNCPVCGMNGASMEYIGNLDENKGVNSEADAYAVIADKVHDIMDACFKVQEMLADVGNLYEPFVKVGPEDLKARAYFDRIAEARRICHSVRHDVCERAHELRMMSILKANMMVKKPEEEE